MNSCFTVMMFTRSKMKMVRRTSVGPACGLGRVLGALSPKLQGSTKAWAGRISIQTAACAKRRITTVRKIQESDSIFNLCATRFNRPSRVYPCKTLYRKGGLRSKKRLLTPFLTRKDIYDGVTRLMSDCPAFGVGGLSAANTCRSPVPSTRNNVTALSAYNARKVS